MTSFGGELAAVQRFTFDLPAGFVELPVRDDELTETTFENLTATVAKLFGMDADHDDAAQAAAGLAAFGAHVGGTGVDYAAAGFYRSPDVPDRPIMLLVCGIGMPSEHTDQSSAIDGLLETHGSTLHSGVEKISLPVGPAVAVVDEDPQYLQVGDESVPILQRRATAWIPDRQGSLIAVISVASNSWQDWEHVCRLAMEIFRSVAWTSSE